MSKRNVKVVKCTYVFQKGPKKGKACGKNSRNGLCKDHNKKKDEYRKKYYDEKIRKPEDVAYEQAVIRISKMTKIAAVKQTMTMMMVKKSERKKFMLKYFGMRLFLGLSTLADVYRTHAIKSVENGDYEDDDAQKKDMDIVLKCNDIDKWPKVATKCIYRGSGTAGSPISGCGEHPVYLEVKKDKTKENIELVRKRYEKMHNINRPMIIRKEKLHCRLMPVLQERLDELEKIRAEAIKKRGEDLFVESSSESESESSEESIDDAEIEKRRIKYNSVLADTKSGMYGDEQIEDIDQINEDSEEHYD